MKEASLHARLLYLHSALKFPGCLPWKQKEAGGDGRIRTADRGFADPRLNHLATSPGRDLERETGFEPATFSLARRRSTPEPLPQTDFINGKNAVNAVTSRSIPHRRLTCQGLGEASRVV